MPITPLPTPAPSRDQPESEFVTNANALFGALPTMVTQINAVETAVDADATSAANSAASALASKNAAAASETAAASSAASAATSALQAAGSVESYQGALAADPTLDKNGNPLAAGDWYINTSTGFIRAYTGSSWVQGISAAAGVSSINGQSGDVTGYVTETGTQSLTNKTLNKAILNDGYTEEVFAITDGTTVNLDPNNGSIQTWTLGASRTPGQANWAAGQSITLMVDDGTAYSITWTTLSVVWVTGGGTAPTLNTSGYTTITLWKVGTTIYGARVGDA